MKLITVSREFGSGGREVGKRLADALNIAYYDREIITALARETDLDEKYVERRLEMPVAAQSFPLTFSHSFAAAAGLSDSAALLGRQNKIVRELAEQGDCVIVGRSADALLEDLHPFKLFIYADTPAKIARCRERASAGENLTDKEYEKRMRQIDKARATNHDLAADYRWGDMRRYHLCVNTTGVEIKSVVPQIAGIFEAWYEENGL